MCSKNETAEIKKLPEITLNDYVVTIPSKQLPKVRVLCLSEKYTPNIIVGSLRT